MPKPTVVFKASVSRRPSAEPVDQPERQLQAEHHQAVENAAAAMPAPAQAQDPDPDKAAVEAATATAEEQPGKALKQGLHAVQSAFLTGNLGKPVTVFTINGLRLTGKLRQFDQYCLLLEGQDGIRSLVFKSALTTVTPAC